MSRLNEVTATDAYIDNIRAEQGACDNQYKIYLVLRDISETLAMLYDDMHSPKMSHEEEVILDEMFKYP
jgi:hypothetical protein